MPVTVCWSAKGGSGTTVVAAALALLDRSTSILVDLAGDLPAALGTVEPTGQGIADWLSSDAPAEALADLAIPLDGAARLIPRGTGPLGPTSPRWRELAEWLRDERLPVVVDAGLGPPPAALLGGARGLLVTRPCYLSLRRTRTMSPRPDGIVLVAEAGRQLRASDVAHSVGAPVVATVSLDPKVARAVDAGLLRNRVPRSLLHQLRRAAASEEIVDQANHRHGAATPPPWRRVRTSGLVVARRSASSPDVRAHQ